MRRRWKLQITAGLMASLMAFVSYDYVSYHRNLESAGSLVTRFGGRSGSLMDWPFGRELRITFDRPLNAEELRELAMLNSLSGRHSVGVMFDCPIDNIEVIR